MSSYLMHPGCTRRRSPTARLHLRFASMHYGVRLRRQEPFNPLSQIKWRVGQRRDDCAKLAAKFGRFGPHRRVPGEDRRQQITLVHVSLRHRIAPQHLQGQWQEAGQSYVLPDQQTHVLDRQLTDRPTPQGMCSSDKTSGVLRRSRPAVAFNLFKGAFIIHAREAPDGQSPGQTPLPGASPADTTTARAGEAMILVVPHILRRHDFRSFAVPLAGAGAGKRELAPEEEVRRWPPGAQPCRCVPLRCPPRHPGRDLGGGRCGSDGGDAFHAGLVEDGQVLGRRDLGEGAVRLDAEAVDGAGDGVLDVDEPLVLGHGEVDHAL